MRLGNGYGIEGKKKQAGHLSTRRTGGYGFVPVALWELFGGRAGKVAAASALALAALSDVAGAS